MLEQSTLSLSRGTVMTGWREGKCRLTQKSANARLFQYLNKLLAKMLLLSANVTDNAGEK